jgi:hypothetical protein
MRLFSDLIPMKRHRPGQSLRATASQAASATSLKPCRLMICWLACARRAERFSSCDGDWRLLGKIFADARDDREMSSRGREL